MEVTKEISLEKSKSQRNILLEIKWYMVAQVAAVYIGGVIGFYHLISGQWKLATILWTLLLKFICGLSMSIGSHRLFGHRSFKANRVLKLFLIFGHSISGQLSVIGWVRSHRAHHKYTDTEKDPTNIKKGFLFAHVYWVFWYSPAVQEAIDSIDISDLTADKDLKFQYDYYLLLHPLFVILFPVLIPYLFWNESLWISNCANFLRLLINLSQISVSNSLMHMEGAKPYDERLSARENIFAILFTLGEGFHNYHHAFPFDYKSAEFGDAKHFNISACLIDLFNKFGWVTDRKTATDAMIAQRKIKSGDGSHWFASDNILKNPSWCNNDDDGGVAEYFKEHHFKNF